MATQVIKKQVGQYKVLFDADAKKVSAKYKNSDDKEATSKVFDTEEQAHTKYVQLSMEETVLTWIEATKAETK